MKQDTVLKSLGDLSLTMFETQSGRPALAGPTPPPTSEQDQTHLAPLMVPAQSDLAGYPHWGLNE